MLYISICTVLSNDSFCNFHLVFIASENGRNVVPYFLLSVLIFSQETLGWDWSVSDHPVLWYTNRALWTVNFSTSLLVLEPGIGPTGIYLLFVISVLKPRELSFFCADFFAISFAVEVAKTDKQKMKGKGSLSDKKKKKKEEEKSHHENWLISNGLSNFKGNNLLLFQAH